MRRNQMIDLAECTEFRQTIESRPPRIVHATVVLLVLLLSTALTWSLIAQAALVVRAPGRVRPVSTPTGVCAAFGPGINGRVAEVNYSEGQTVQAGQVLIRLDTEQLDNDIDKQARVIETLEDETSRFTGLHELRNRQFAAAREKGQAELDRAMADVERARATRESAIRQATLDLEHAEARLAQKRDLYNRKALSRAELMDAESMFEQAREKLAEVQLPVEESTVQVARRALSLIEQEHAAQHAELEINQLTKVGQLETARRELAGLQLERQQAILKAPHDGVVITSAVKVGDVVERGRAVLEIAERTGFHFEVAVPSGDVGQLRPGMPVRIKFDDFDHQEYGTLEGSVCFISPDSRLSEHDRGTSIYEIEVEVAGQTLRRGAKSGEIRLGMSGQAEIVTGQESLLVLLVTKIRQTISLG